MGAMTKLSGATPITPINTSCKTLLTKEAIAISKMAFSQNVEEVESQWWGFRQPLHRTISEDKAAPVHSLPDDVLQLIFSRLPRRSLAVTRLVCSSWKRVCEHQDMAVLRQQMGVAEGWIYVLAEKPSEAPFRAYDPKGDKWSVLPPTPGRTGGQQWQGFACVALRHKLLLIGGSRTNKSPTSDKYASGVVCGDVVVFDALKNQWSRASSMKTPRSWFATAVIGTKVYVAGGQGNTRFLDSAEVYDSETDTWEALPTMGNVRSSCHGVVLDGQFWVIAGEYVRNHYDDHQKSSAEFYDAKTNTWQFIPNMWLDNHKVIGPNTVVNGELVCVHQRKVMSYNKEMNSWNQLGHISGGEIYNRPFSRFGFACESVENNLYIIGGTRDYTSNRTHYCSQLNTIEICDLQSAKAISQAWWKLGADMGQGKGIISASAVLWL